MCKCLSGCLEYVAYRAGWESHTILYSVHNSGGVVGYDGVVEEVEGAGLCTL